MAEKYEASEGDLATMRRIGGEVARRLRVPFLVIDFAETAEGEWVVIECNDGQDSGYAGVDARAMWRRVIGILGG